MKYKQLLRFTGWYFLANTLVFWILGYSFLKSILLHDTLYKTMIADFSSVIGKSVVLSFTLINYLSYMMLLAFIPALLVIALIALIPNRRVILPFSALVATISVLFLLMDSQIYSMFKFHLNGTIIHFIMSTDWGGLFGFSEAEIWGFIGVIVLILILEYLLAGLIWNQVIVPARFTAGRLIVLIWFGGICVSYFTLTMSIVHYNNIFSQQIPNLPLFSKLYAYVFPSSDSKRMIYNWSEQFFIQPPFSNEPLNYPQKALRCKKPKHPTNIILIMADALRFDTVNRQVMPHVSQFAEQRWQFQNNLSGGNSTQAGLFSLFYSLPSSYWTAAKTERKAPVLMDVLRENNYDIKVIWSSFITPPAFDQTIYLNVPDLNVGGALGNDTAEKDKNTTDEALRYLSNARPQQPFFMHLFYDATHSYCRKQTYSKPFQPAKENCLRFGISDELEPLPYYNRYLNAAHFLDAEIHRLLVYLQQNGYYENSIVIITSDHGEEFNDNQQNYWGHSGNYTQTQVHTPMIVHWPGAIPQRFNHRTSGYDLVPTLLQGLFSCENPISDYSIGQHLLNKHNRDSFILAGSYVNMGIIESDRLTTLEASGHIKITNPKAKVDEQAIPRTHIIHQALNLMRTYYKK
ncbi:DUF3413 domain-containing protein [Legionella yabuuchiae]|uniref:DUF3413 domain-containing protein n=1 Tax=Legionella yabuuchiae TaxID=376727 RepID=UPI001054F040|nr:DUF3413 domain-containing protein [Legionella yabuuchiae]